MKAICGWLGMPSEPVDGDAMLAAMLGREPVRDHTVRSADLNAALDGGGAGDGLGRARASDSGVQLCYADDDLALVVTEPTSLGDAEAIAIAYRRADTAVLDEMHGPFALALADRRKQRFLVTIDRAGIRPLYLLEHRGALFFASRLEAIRRIPGFVAEISDQAVFDYLYFHMIPSPGSIYRGVSKLLPAQLVMCDGAGRSERFYWQMPYREDHSGRFGRLRAEFRALLPQVVGDAGASGTRVGCFLSGGTDSSTVSGTWRQLRGESVPTYSMGFAVPGFDEMEYARIAARHFDTTAREFYVTAADVVDAIPRIAAYCDEPFGNASIVPAYLCARFAREDGIDTMLAGDGGDEIFGGNERYANQWLFELYGGVPTPLRALLEPALRLPGLGGLRAVRKARSYIEQAEVPLPDRFETYNFLHRTPLADIFEADFLGRVNSEAPLHNLREVYGRTISASAINRMMHLDLKITLADNDLRKVNQACALAGVDVRYPLLDDRMLAFAASVPPTMQLKHTRLRWFFKKALADFLPGEIVRKRKQGFGLPVGLWMVDYAPLREMAHDSLATLKRRGVVRPSYIDWIEEKHMSEHASYYGVMLWILVMLEQWLQTREPGSTMA
jgi:asparagine synthase (glutamine-hydrolysing)